METCKVFENESDADIDVKTMSILKRMLQEVSTDGLPTSTDEPMETCKVFEFKIADNEEDGEDPSNQDLEQMSRFDLNKEINEHKAEDANGLQFGWHAMIQPLQRNWRWFHEQREQRAYSAFLEFLLTCFYLHSLKVSQLEKESQEQRERCKMLSAELEKANNLHGTWLKSLKDV